MAPRPVPASVGQRLLGIIEHYRADHGALNCPLLCRLSGDVDVVTVRRALTALTARHEALRTTFTGRGPRLSQLVHEPRPVELTVVDLRGEPDPHAAADAAVAAELATRVDVAHWPTRATAWRVTDHEVILCFTMHHLVTDAWSCGLLFEELRTLCTGSPAELPPVHWQYPQFVAWQEDRLAGAELERQRAFWRDQLTGLRLPRLPYREPPPGATPGVLARDLDTGVADGLRALARRHRTTLFTVALAVYYAVLHRVTGQGDLAVASLFANRSRPESQGTVGFCANMVVLRTRLPPFATFQALVQATHATTAAAFANQEQPYQAVSTGSANLGGRVDDVVFQMMAELAHRVRVGDTEFELLVPEAIGSRFGTELALAPRGNGLRVVLFHTPRLAPADAVRLLDGYVTVARAVVANPGAALSTLLRR
ncbi:MULTISPECIES: condensation domain-containing protein [unclassified Micromonospora]|uniref:condensation domain-containing protein n=1 Tax=unclassified Micromonospora TaxID=2617518 RepID=UPI0033A2E6C6